jgi:NTP pyrophosphatase (non-canonical NTP hydrolase)
MSEKQLELFNNIKMYEDYDRFVEDVWLGSPEMDETKAELNFIGLAICEEAGEVAGKLKKLSRGDGNITVEQIVNELGDVLYYVTKLAHELNVGLAELTMINTKKLQKRVEKGTMKGSGDDR